MCPSYKAPIIEAFVKYRIQRSIVEPNSLGPNNTIVTATATAPGRAAPE